MRPEHARDTRHHQDIRIRLQDLFLNRRICQTRLVSAIFSALVIRALECVVVVDKRHRIALQTLRAQTVQGLVLVQLTVRLALEFVQTVLQREVKNHRVVVRLNQMLFLALKAFPQLRNGDVRIRSLIVHTQVLAIVAQGHIIPESVVFHHIEQPLRICLRPVLHYLTRMIQVARAIKIATCIRGTAIRRSRIVAIRT